MKRQLLHNNRIVLFAIALLFSLTPCKVKASLFENFGISYEQTLNQSKAPSNCNSSCFINQKEIGLKSAGIATPKIAVVRRYFSIKEKVDKEMLFTKVISLQLPPKYILYKQFKFDVV
ncbi:hypothetical protein FLAN108750_09905 [Flavobacterium antarcticum]|uniref:hypothetical protein n=1 Tax=Flavobacterium antarcticum TaxID=271155 RepID=UPI0003B4CAA6|nr:hypothetical protein [Flavobacterium antarcticum]